MNLGVEVGARKTFANYLDDVDPENYVDENLLLTERGAKTVELA